MKQSEKIKPRLSVGTIKHIFEFYNVYKLEVWDVVIESEKHCSTQSSYSVFANSAAEAEERGLILAEKDGIKKAYCSSAEFKCYVY